jgi:hypothetical protein
MTSFQRKTLRVDVNYPSVSPAQPKPQTTQTNKIGKNKMAQRKETKKNIKVRDLKPRKDARGGVIVDVSTKTHQQSHSVQGHNLNRLGRGGS